VVGGQGSGLLGAGAVGRWQVRGTARLGRWWLSSAGIMGSGLVCHLSRYFFAMSRPLRIECAGALYHVTARGEGGENIFVALAERTEWLSVFASVSPEFKWAVPAYCLMDNHSHRLVETAEGNLSSGRRPLNGMYTQRFQSVPGPSRTRLPRALAGHVGSKGSVPPRTGPL